VGWLAGLDPAQPDGGGLAEGQAETVLLAAVTAQRLDREGWQGEDGVAGRGLERPDRQLFAAATHPSAAVAIGGRTLQLSGLAIREQSGVVRQRALVPGEVRCQRDEREGGRLPLPPDVHQGQGQKGPHRVV
jgi:hypothetical protein